MKKTVWAGVAALVGIALAGQAHAATMPITFSGPGVSGSLEITFGRARTQNTQMPLRSLE